MAIESVFAFAGMVFLLVVSPGPNMFLIIKNVSVQGIKIGLFNTFGIVSAIIIHGSLASLGLSSIIVASANLFALIKILGAMYLCFLGIRTILVSCRKGSKSIPEKSNRINKKRLGNAYVEGLVINLLNPKTALFYLAIFSQFVQKESAVFDSLFLIMIHGSIAFTWYFLVAAGMRKGKNVVFLKHHHQHFFKKYQGSYSYIQGFGWQYHRSELAMSRY